MKKLLILTSVALFATACCCGVGGAGSTTDTNSDSINTMQTQSTFEKKYTNADYYKDGIFQQDIAKKAFLEMFAHYDYPMTEFLESNIWFVDFGLGDFENCGMGGVFFVNDSINGYFAHAIYLLPSQMIPEHKHVKTAYAAKMESWMVEKGWCYNYSEVGAPTADAPSIARSQVATTVSKKFVVQQVGQIVHLADAGAQTWHFLLAGPQGAIVSEWANYHDAAGLRFSNPKAKM